MSYILCLAVEGYQYKKQPLIRLFLDKKFLYEFYLQSKKSINNFTESMVGDIRDHIFDKKYNSFFKKNFLQNSSTHQKILFLKKNVLSNNIHYFFFELDKNQLCNSKEFILEIFNNDSNFTNGFLTKSTLVSIKLMYLIPKKIVKDYENFCKLWEDKLQEEKNRYKTLNDIKSSYKNKTGLQKNLFNLLDKNLIVLTNKGQNNEHLQQSILHGASFKCWIGGYTKLTIPFKNYLNEDNLVFNDTNEHFVTYLLCNKYKEYEDYGNNY